MDKVYAAKTAKCGYFGSDSCESLDFLLEAKACDGKPEPVIEAMRGQTVCAAVEVELGAAFARRQFLHPAHKRLGIALAAMAFERDQIIDIKRLAPGQPFRGAKTGAGDRRARILRIDEPPARLLPLAIGAGEKILHVRNMRPQHLDDGEAAADIGLADGFFHCDHLGALSRPFTVALALAKSIWPA